MRFLTHSFFVRSISLCLTFLAFSQIQLHAQEIKFPEFDQSLMRNGQSTLAYRRFLESPVYSPMKKKIRYIKNEFKNLYKKNILTFNNDSKAVTKIPRVIHQIWLGSPVPEKFKTWINSWKNMKGWQYKLWTDADVKKISLHNQALYDNAKNFGEKSDILRYEILFNEGGLYVDIDFENCDSELIEKLGNSFDFYAGFEPIEHWALMKRVLLGNAIIGSVAGHPILQNLIFDMAENYSKFSKNGKVPNTVIATGPGYFTEKVIEYNQSENIAFSNIFLPPTFLYPINLIESENESADALIKLIRPETAGIHYWSGSWIENHKKPLAKKQGVEFIMQIPEFDPSL